MEEFFEAASAAEIEKATGFQVARPTGVSASDYSAHVVEVACSPVWRALHVRGDGTAVERAG
eukprot:2466890-Amphidinium_carterae.1